MNMGYIEFKRQVETRDINSAMLAHTVLKVKGLDEITTEEKAKQFGVLQC